MQKWIQVMRKVEMLMTTYYTNIFMTNYIVFTEYKMALG
jgi:hypothetical protein